MESVKRYEPLYRLHIFIAQTNRLDGVMGEAGDGTSGDNTDRAQRVAFKREITVETATAATSTTAASTTEATPKTEAASKTAAKSRGSKATRCPDTGTRASNRAGWSCTDGACGYTTKQYLA